MKYDYLIVGAGLYGSVFAHCATKHGKRCLVIDKRPHLGGNLYCDKVEGINVHKYGPHIFHTSNKEVWNFVNSIVEFNRFTESPVAFYKGKAYNLPFNMNTFSQMWGVLTPEEAKQKIAEQRKEMEGKTPANLEEQAISLVGRDIYERLIKGYTEKQWGRKCTELPPFIIKRLPVRFVYDNNYFNDSYQGVPIGGYNKLIDGLLKGVDTMVNVDFFEERKRNNSQFSILNSIRLCLLARLMNSMTIDLENWNTVLSALSMRFLTPQTIKAWHKSTIQMPLFLTPESLSISILSRLLPMSIRIQRRSSAGNTP